MKSFMQIIAIGFMGSFLFVSTTVSPMGTYKIEITTTEENALVTAIQQYSNLTKADVDAWKFSWAPLIGRYFRGRIIDKINNFVKVCQSLLFVKYSFGNEVHLRGYREGDIYVPASWDITMICLALNNMREQAIYALALLAQVGTSEETELKEKINLYLTNINYNKTRLACQHWEHVKEIQEANKVIAARTKQEMDELYWRSMLFKWELAKQIGSNVFKGTKWLVQTAHEYSGPLATGAIIWFVYQKTFGLKK